MTLGRTKREIAWLAEGHPDPGPGTPIGVRIAKTTPLPEKRFWDLISRTVSPTTGAHRLDASQADRFTIRMRLLIEALDGDDHRSAAEKVLGFVSDDFWEDTRAWVVTLGWDRYSAVLADPHVLTKELMGLDPGGDFSHAEALLYLTGDDE